MKQRATVFAVLLVGLLGVAACRSTSGGTPWREASQLVLGEGSDHVQVLEGVALGEYLSTFVPDERTGFLLTHNTRTGYIVVGGTRYLVTASDEKTAEGRDLLTIHSGAQPLHLMQR